MSRKAWMALFAAAALILIARPSLAEEGSELKNILIQKDSGQLVVTLIMDQAVVYESFTLLGPNRLILDLQNTTSFAIEPMITVEHLGVQFIRTAQNRVDVTRIVFDFPGDMPLYSIRDSSEGISVTFREPEPKPIESTVPKELLIEEKPAPMETKPKPAVLEPSSPSAEEKPIPAPDPILPGRMIGLGLQSGFYFMQDADFKELYGTGALFFGMEAAYFFFLSNQEAVSICLEGKAISAKGQTSFLDEDITLRLIPFSLSAAYLRKYGAFMPFVALGADLLSYRETYPKDFAVPEVSGSAVGLNIQLGAYASISENIFFKAFWKLHSIRTEISEGLIVDFGGHEIGLSAGYRFNF